MSWESYHWALCTFFRPHLPIQLNRFQIVSPSLTILQSTNSPSSSSTYPFQKTRVSHSWKVWCERCSTCGLKLIAKRRQWVPPQSKGKFDDYVALIRTYTVKYWALVGDWVSSNLTTFQYWLLSHLLRNRSELGLSARIYHLFLSIVRSIVLLYQINGIRI